MRDVFIKTLSKVCEEDSNLILITGDLGFGVLNDFKKNFPLQYINSGVAEQNMTGLATGLSLTGKRTFTYSIGNFCTLRCLEQIRNDACYHEANVNIICVGGGFSYGQLGYSHHATEDISIMRALPNIRVFVPGDLYETEKITDYMTRSEGVNYLRLDKSWPEQTDTDNSEFIVGKARKVREGNDFSIIVSGGILKVALEVADHFRNLNVKIRVLSMHTIKPIDREAIIECAKETGGILTLEEHTITGGLGSAVAEVLIDESILPKTIVRMGLKAGFTTTVGTQDYLRKEYGIDKNSLIKEINNRLA